MSAEQQVLPDQRLRSQDSKMVEWLNERVRQEPLMLAFDSKAHNLSVPLAGGNYLELTVNTKRSKKNLTISFIDAQRDDETVRVRRGDNNFTGGWQFDGASEPWYIGGSMGGYGREKMSIEEGLQIMRLAYYKLNRDVS